jgi:uncharacterized membrane protein YdjX (TVP38/TMEM64 family)
MAQTAIPAWRPRAVTAGKLLLAALVVAAIVLLVRRAPIDETVVLLKQEVGEMGLWAPLAFGGALVVLTALLLPATPVVLASGAAFGPVLGVVVVSLATTASAALSFAVSRLLARRRVAAYVRRYPKLHAIYDALGGPAGWQVVIAVRLSHALPFGVQNLLFGASPVRFWPFLAATWVSMLPGSVLYVFLGHVAARALEEGSGAGPAVGPADWAVRAAGLAVAALAALYVTRLGRRILREKAHVDLASPLVPGDPAD